MLIVYTPRNLPQERRVVSLLDTEEVAKQIITLLENGAEVITEEHSGRLHITNVKTKGSETKEADNIHQQL